MDLPALVYPTNATMGRLESSLLFRLIALAFSASFRAFSILYISLKTCLLSVSNFCSPGPLVPMPPPSLER